MTHLKLCILIIVLGLLVHKGIEIAYYKSVEDFHANLGINVGEYK